MTLKKGDFIELDYTGKLEDGTVFDTTIEAIAKEHGLNAKAGFKPVIICLGEGHLLRGLDAVLEGKDLGKYEAKLTAEQAFGKKDTKLLKLIPAAKFKEAKIEPYPGLEVNIDNHYGIIRSVSGGRITVDFNHPLAGKNVVYEVVVKRIVEKPEERIQAILDVIGVHHHGVTMENEKHAVIKMHDIPPQELAEQLNRMITEKTDIETVSYHADAAGHDESK